MNPQRWQQFLAFVGRARAKPTFDWEEREYRLQVAAELRAALAGPPDASLGEALERVFDRRPTAGGYGLTSRPENAWLKAWARAPDTSLPAVLHRFPDSAPDAVGRFEYFVGAAEKADAATSAKAVMAAGSLVNFAYECESLPVVRSEPFDQIEATLGFEVPGGATLGEQYARHLGFAREVLGRMQQAGIAARDMLDAGALIALAAQDEEIWASGFGRWDLEPAAATGPHAGRAPGSPLASPQKGAPYLSICAIYRDEAQNLREWIEFHRIVGVERFFLYNNGSTDDHREVLAPFVADGTVVLHEWPVFPGRRSPLNPQNAAYDDCLRWHRRDSRWIAFIDVDEFLFSPAGAPLPEALTEYEAWPAVVVNWATFYFCGHQVRPDGLLIENYRRRVNAPTNRQVKSIVQPAVTIRSLTAHHFIYAWLSAVDENLYPANGFTRKSISFSRLRLNHYYTKSEAEFVLKAARPDAGGGPRRVADGERLASLREVEETAGETDEAILRYLPALREALE